MTHELADKGSLATLAQRQSSLPPLIVTLDGPAGVGKSTLAKQVAQALGIGYLDTGAMFRVVALRSLNLPDAPLSGDGSALLASVLPLNFRLSTDKEESELLCNNDPIGSAIRSEKVAARAARIAALPAIRDFLKWAQQSIGETTSLVAEGRDMGTVVFPQAQHKFFLDASVEVRAKRRYDQLIQMRQPADLKEIARQIHLRDDQDRNRTVAPLSAAKDAIIIDTSSLTIEGVLATILNHCRRQ